MEASAIGGHSDIYKLIYNHILNIPSDQILMEIMLDINFNSIIPNIDAWLGDLPFNEGIVGYTDGSRRDDLSGSKIFCERLGSVNRRTILLNNSVCKNIEA